MNRSAVAIPVAMMFVAVSMMFTTLGAISALGGFRVICWVAGPMFAVIAVVIAFRRLRYQQRELKEQQARQRPTSR